MKRFVYLLILLILPAVLAGCVTALKTAPAKQISEEKGQFNLIYLVSSKRDDVRNAIVLDRLGDEYRFVPDVRDFDYEILQDISIDEAVNEANIFFRSFPYTVGGDVKSINDNEGNIVGYEFRPYYDIKLYGILDILDIDYTTKADKRVYIDIAVKLNLIRRIPVDY
jgi:hypothetical protein